MQVGDLVMESPERAWGCLLDGDVCDSLGIIIEVDHGIATVSWLYHDIFGQHESYCMSNGLEVVCK